MDVPISGGDQDGAYGEGEQPCLSATESVIHLPPNSRPACGLNRYNAGVVGSFLGQTRPFPICKSGHEGGPAGASVG